MSEPAAPIDDHTIRNLDERTVERIAAGEVVERPASVVKELVENSLDAGATRITVEIEAGGVDRIVISDDGVGMTKAGARKAIERHTTSKLRHASELETGITTLGFRGEALYTVAAVSRLSIQTRPADGSGTELRIAGGELESIEPAGCPPGTTIEVRDLFYNVPARREFLSSRTTEFDHINRIVANYALANPAVAFSLSHDGRSVFSTPGRGDLRSVILAVYGRDVAESMIEVDAAFEDGSLERLTGMVSHPETTRSRARYLSTFINNRYVKSDQLRNAILSAYGGQLAPDRYPFVVLFCEVAPGMVDVNVHPRKLAVRFDTPDQVTQRVETAVREALLEAGLIRSTAARGRGTPTEANVLPDSATEPADPPRGGRSTSASEKRRPSQTHSRDRTAPPDQPGRIRGGESQESLTTEDTGPVIDRLPDLRVLGQLDETFIVAETGDGLLLIDQHAADERIHFEQLRKRLADRNDRQQLVNPVCVPITPDEAAAFENAARSLAELGFEATIRNKNELRVTTVPGVFEKTLEPPMIRDTLASAIDSAVDVGEMTAMTDALLADMACHPAVTGNTALTDGSIVELLEALDHCENPFACPHGRPTLIRIDYDELADRFERDYPGHAERRREGDH